MSLKSLSTSDRGATALLIAGAMMLIMGIAAVVIDGGFGFSERRQTQAGVDFGALAALQAAKSCGVSCSIPAAVNNGAAEARTVVEANLPGRTLDWGEVDCDPNRPAEYTEVASTTNCVSFTENLDKARVALPDDVLDTSFGRVIGFNTITVVSQAEAGALIEASTDVIPHTPTSSAGGEACLFANQAPQSVPPCDGAISGFFGYLDVALFGSDAKGTPSTCDNGTSNTRVAINMSKGGDHNLVEYSFGPPAADAVVDDFDACPNTEENINQVRVQTGSPTSGATDGLLDGISGSINGQPFTPEPGRIICDTTNYSTACEWIRGTTYNIDHTPLWTFLVSGTCPGPDPTNHDEMRDCLDNYPPGNPPQFTAAIGDHPRFAAIPLLYSNGANPNDPAPSGPGAYKIKEFIPIWIETLFFSCSAPSCDTIHSPGLSTPPPACPNPIDPAIRNCGWSHSSGGDDIESIIAFTLDLSMLPPEITATFPGTKEVRQYALTK